MINHTMLGTNDLAAATKFYDEALGALGYKRTGSLDGHGQVREVLENLVWFASAEGFDVRSFRASYS